MNHKVLVIGPLNKGALAESYARAFERLGMEVVRFDSEVALRAGEPLCRQPHSASCHALVVCGTRSIARLAKSRSAFSPR